MYQIINRSWLLIILLISVYGEASYACPQPLAKVISIQGKVDSQYIGNSRWQAISLNQTFCLGDKIRTTKYSRVTLLFSNNTRATLDQNTTLIFSNPSSEKPSWILNIIKGSTFFRSRQPQQLNIQTPFINAVHEGTEFLVSVNTTQTKISVFDGQVAATNEQGKIQIKKGFSGIAKDKQAPQLQALKIQPEDAVQWSLYYPPIIDYQAINFSNNELLKKVIRLYQQGDILQALKLLDESTKTNKQSQHLLLKSSLLLSIGRVDDTQGIINQIVKTDTDNGHAKAIQSIISVTKNQSDKALELALQSVKHSPQSTTGYIALSYAYQSKFDITSALQATQKAVSLSPNNALAWARLSELQLSSGIQKDALLSAQKAQQLNPNLARTQTILGFAYLSQVNISQAESAFQLAINLDTTDPLAYLGLGLSFIRSGNLESGTQEIETAVSLDPDNAIMRSYLGKAYYELKNDAFSATEFTLAKELDPNDPTPWFYDAIRKQNSNQPVHALQDMQHAIELNDNRGIYRSKLLLDEDAAARSANMARIYQDLDFDRVALKQAWSSLSQDYTNPSAHRFLSDTLQGKPRQRIARASELLQAQLFQPINSIPVQPQLTSENSGILNSTGPGSLSSNEYDSLFTSNGAHVLLNGAIGSNNTLTDSAIISGVYDRFSLSMGQFHYRTDGFRTNDDYKQNIYNAFAQIAVTNSLNIQFEFKTEDVTAGDVAFRLNDYHQENVRQSKDQDTARFGLRYSIDAEQDIIVSGFLTDFKEITTDQASTVTETLSPPFFNIKSTEINNEQINFEESGYQLEAQYLFHPESFNIISGIGYLNLDAQRESTLNTVITDELTQFFPFPNSSTVVTGPSLLSSSTSLETNYFNSYLYSNIEIAEGLSSTLGLSFDSYDDSLVKINQFNPKFGLIWAPENNVSLRGAVFRSIKRPLAGSQTIEPTQIAGFNQFYDDNDGTNAWQYGVGLDYRPLKNIYVGAESIWRNTKQPEITVKNTANIIDRNESSHLAYAYWTPLDWLALSSKYHFDEFHKDYAANKANVINPRSITTHHFLLNLNLYHSSGVFTNLSTSYINQNAEFPTTTGLNNEADRFWLFDSSFGIRLPKRIGTLSLEVKNIFNKEFLYQSEWNTSGSLLSNFVPEREFFLKLNITY